MYTQIREILDRELDRQETTIELIASENFASDAVMKLCGSEFTNKYAEGYPGKRYYNGCSHIDEIEELAINTLCKLYESKFANVQPHCGANSNTAAYQALLNPGDTILGMDLASGGHLSHGAKFNISGKVYNAHHYGVDEDGWLDYDYIHRIAKKVKPKLIIAGASAYPRRINWAELADIADYNNAYLMADIAHYSGLIAGGWYPNPTEWVHVVTSTTHKTLRGPRGGFILWNDDKFTKKINSAIFPGTQGGPLMNMIAAKAQAFMEADTDEFKLYIRHVIENAKEMCKVFIENGYHVQTKGTDSHIVLLNLIDKKYSGRQAADLLEENDITLNKNGVPNDPRSFVETSGIRIGTAAETTRGHDKPWFRNLAQRICDILNS
tara:strand:- start:134710 stop:135852 length:1143 start_codon:yes stop_codon:yes gene_type:complete